MEEIWKDVEEYEGLYKVSSLGKVKSLDRIVINKGRKPYSIKGIMLKLSPHSKGYRSVSFVKNGIEKSFVVHRVVAKAFIPNPENKPQVNHINLDKKDNVLSNLEWVTSKENMQHASINGVMKQTESTKKKISFKNSVIIYQYDLDMKLVGLYPSYIKAEEITGTSSQMISLCCRGKREVSCGFIWSKTLL